MQARSLSSFAPIKIHRGGTERRCLLHQAKQVGNQRLLLTLGSKVHRVWGARSSVCEARLGVQGIGLEVPGLYRALQYPGLGVRGLQFFGVQGLEGLAWVSGFGVQGSSSRVQGFFRASLILEVIAAVAVA